MTKPSSEAQSALDRLNAELAANAKARGATLSWSPRELELLDQLAATIDRRADIQTAYTMAVAGDDVKVVVKLSAELRLLDKAVQAIYKDIDTDVPVAETPTTVKARRAVSTRWDNERARNAAR